MNKHVKQLSDQARSLSAAALADRVDDLLVALHHADPNIDKIWSAECERRLDAFLQGETIARDAGEVLAKPLKP